jgi:uncharacterized protein
MQNRFFIFIAIIIVFTILIDIYSYIGVHSFFRNSSPSARYFFTVLFWAVTAVFVIVFLFFFRIDYQKRNPSDLSGLFILVGIYMLVYLPKMIFCAFRASEDIIWLTGKGINFVSEAFGGKGMSSFRFPVISKSGLVLSFIVFGAILTGILGRFNYTLEKVDVGIRNLPERLDGLKIIQLSDIHLGSLHGKQDKIRKAIEMINSEDADLILFTGDLVNNFSEEAHGWEEVFAGVKREHGMYSILGNHDYGDYWSWKSEEEKRSNMELLMNIEKNMGFRLLANQWDTVNINGETIGIIGVENWGLPPFSQHGDLVKAMDGLPPVSLKILLSHNPTHWDAEILNKTDIPLTLSGHTHAMQFGIKLGDYRWSPARLIYNRYWGLYRENDQSLYVNRGFGFIGFPGRVGHRPEITLITLRRE